MARTKKSKPGYWARRELRERRQLEKVEEWKQQQNEEKLAEITDVQLSLNTKAKHDEAEMDVEDDSEDGGVSLNQRASAPYETVLIPCNNAVGPTLYFQRPLSALDDTEDLWRLPVEPIDLRPHLLKRIGVTLKSGKIYHQCCRLILNHWRCKPEVCIPDSLRSRTFYSLAMLLKLRRLANITKNNYDLAASLMLEAWRERASHLPNFDPSNRIFMVQTPINIHKECEHAIQENVYGLMVEDLSKAAQKLIEKGEPSVQTGSTRKAALRMAGNLIPEDERAGVADKVTRRRRDEKKKACVSQQAELRQGRFDLLRDAQDSEAQGLTTAPPNSPVQSNASFATPQFTLSIRTRPGQQGPVPSTVVAQQPSLSAATALEISNRDKENCNGLAAMMNKMDVERNLKQGKRRFKRLAAGGQSRLAASGPLPSERTDLSNLPALPALGSATDTQQLLRLGQKPLPD